MRTNPRIHVNNGLLIGCLLHALYKTSTSSTPRRFFFSFLSFSPLAFHIRIDCLACLVGLHRDLQEPVLRSDPGPPGFILAPNLRGGVLKN